MPTHRQVIETLIAERDELRLLLCECWPYLKRVIHPAADGKRALELRGRVEELSRLWSTEADPCDTEPPSP